MNNSLYDVIIIGGGPAGYTGALYCARAGYSTLVIEKFSAGGQMTQTSQIDNFPGFDEGIDGFTLGFKMQNTAERFGAKTYQTEVLKVDLKDQIKIIETADATFRSKTVIIATGAEHKHLGLENEKELIGRGLGYCAACDGMFYKGKTVCVIGGGNSAAIDALLLSKICEKVILIHRRNTLRAEKYYQDRIIETKNIQFVYNSVVEEFLFDDKVSGVRVKNVIDNTQTVFPLSGIFISIGRYPQTELFKGQVDIDKNGYIIADETTQTNLGGVFAAGDVRTKTLRQIVTAASDGATAAHFVGEYFTHLN